MKRSSINLNPLLLIGLGAGAMYFLDPSHGRRRRALMRDKCTSIARRSACAATKTREDLSNRTRGLIASTLGWFRKRPTSDQVVAARIHSSLGRVVSHPHAISVDVKNGCAILKGHVLSSELKELIASTGARCGVKAVENQLQVHEQAGTIPSLQGGHAPCKSKFVLSKTHWPPAARFITGVGGGGAVIYGLWRGGVLGKVLAVGGGALVVRAATNLDFSHLTGVGAGTSAVDLRKSITINAPIEEVFDYWANFGNFPQFMTHVQSIEMLGQGRTHWTVSGPAGAKVEWTAVETEFVPYELLAWKTEPGSLVEHKGLVRFAQTGENGTRLDIFMSYNPVMGAIGHGIARLLGSDPKRTLDFDLLRFKTICEKSHASMQKSRGQSESESMSEGL